MIVRTKRNLFMYRTLPLCWTFLALRHSRRNVINERGMDGLMNGCRDVETEESLKNTSAAQFNNLSAAFISGTFNYQ